MAITLEGSPQLISPGFNPTYFYASSNNTAFDAFRYIVKITNEQTSEVMANLNVLPRYGDDFLEVNISKILTSDLGILQDGTVDLNTPFVFENADACGFDYRVQIGEHYLYTWPYVRLLVDSSTDPGTDYVRLGNALTTPNYIVGDLINVVGAAEPYSFTDNFFVSGSTTGFLVASHPFNTGDTITVVQTEPTAVPGYNGAWTVNAATTPTMVVLDVPYQGNSLVQPGELIRNAAYDGLHEVIAIGADYVTIDQLWIDNPANNLAGETTYQDRRLFADTSLYNQVFYTFNGAKSHIDFLDWDAADYNPSGTGQSYLSIANDFHKFVRQDNDVFLNFWGRERAGAQFKVNIKIFDANANLTSEIEGLNTITTETQILALSCGPKIINDISGGIYYTTISGTGLIEDDTSYYIVQVLSGLPPVVNQTDAIKIFMDQSCTGRFDNYPLLFMDRMGSYLPVNFTLANKQKISNKKKEASQFIGGLNATTNQYEYSLADSRERTYGVAVEEEWELNTNWLTEGEVATYEELISSPSVYLQLLSGTYIPVQVTDKRFERKFKNTTKMIKYKVKIRFSNNDTVQGT